MLRFQQIGVGPVLGPGCCRARRCARQVWGREGNCGGSAVAVLRRGTLLHVLFAHNSGHYFLSPFLTVPLRSVYASVSEAFGRNSQFFLCEMYTDAVMVLVLAGLCGGSAVAVHLRIPGDALN